MKIKLAGMILEFLEWGIRMLREGIWMLKCVFGCSREAFGYARYNAWAAEVEGIRIPKDGIQMPKIAFGCPRGAFGYTK